MDWQVDYHPNGEILGIDGWDLKDFAYELNGDKIAFKGSNKITLSGRSLLSSQASKVLEIKLKDFLKTLTDDTEKTIIQEVIRIISQFDIVTQRLSGFNEMLTGLDINDIIPITVKNKKLKDAVNGGMLGLPMNTAQTFPLRSGFLVPHTLRVTDDFGLAIYPLYPKMQEHLELLKAVGTDNEASKGKKLTMLPPRIIQPSRITLNWIGANTEKPLQIANDDNPIIGWIMTDF
ncbi:MAG: hypothetical protein HC803_05590 [Saprospiraceae bacterium]|nr:hypothetical protein [Saprospiraceae bacterium]